MVLPLPANLDQATRLSHPAWTLDIADWVTAVPGLILRAEVQVPVTVFETRRLLQGPALYGFLKSLVFICLAFMGPEITESMM